MRALSFAWISATLVTACGSVVDPPDGEVSISPRMPKTMDDLVASSTSDDDRLSFQWTKSGAVRTDLFENTVDAALTTKGDVWRVDLVTDTGVSVSSDEVTIVNSAPATPVLTFTPAGPLFEGASIVCSVTTPEPDADGDPVTYLANWSKNNTPLVGATMTAFAGDTVPGAQVALNDIFVCTVSASDGADASVAAVHSAMTTCLAPAALTATLAANGSGPTGTLQMFTVPTSVCRLRIEAAGAVGGDNNGVAGSVNGASMNGTFDVTPGSMLKVLVGQPAGPGAIGTQNLSGGGGTFVLTAADAPLIIAGGGGSHFAANPAVAETVGRVETSGGTVGTTVRADNGMGGNVEATSTSGAGGGLLTSGAGVGGGRGFTQGGTGGAVPTTETAVGGYGGGGARGGSFGQGAGGGYSGGSCGDTSGTWVGCGGGGSFNSGTAQVNTAGSNPAAGYVRISW
ncbi:MAG: hypothetical protein H0T42_17170 [Deltaproteobacteria bacterium]|nr:hypothetical protein [Deltaproteobacteria bacterium]